jgi:hypothetical protein
MDVDYVKLDAEQEAELERLSALNYSLAEMAAYFDVPLNQFIHDATVEGCVIKYRIERGKLLLRAGPEMQLFAAAEKGSLTAIQMLSRILSDRRYYDVLRELCEAEYAG